MRALHGQRWHEHVTLALSGGRKRKESVPTGRTEQEINQVEGELWGPTGSRGRADLGRLRCRKHTPPCLPVADTLPPHNPASLAPTSELLPGASDQSPGTWRQSPHPPTVARGRHHPNITLLAGSPATLSLPEHMKAPSFAQALGLLACRKTDN